MPQYVAGTEIESSRKEYVAGFPKTGKVLKTMGLLSSANITIVSAMFGSMFIAFTWLIICIFNSLSIWAIDKMREELEIKGGARC